MPTFKSSLLEQLNTLPPFVVWALARTSRGKRPTVPELAKAAGMPWRTFTRIARRSTWNNVKAAQIDAFCRACNVDLLHQFQHRHYLRVTLRTKRPLMHLSDHQLKTFQEQCAKWRESHKATPAAPSP